MIGILVITHGPLGESLIKSAELITKKTDNCASLGLYHGDNIEDFKGEIERNMKKLDQGHGVMVFSDLWGGSPSNSISYLMRDSNINFEAFTGINLPILLESLMLRESLPLEDLRKHINEISMSTIIDIRKMVMEHED